MALNEYGALETQLKRKAALQGEAAKRKLEQQFASQGRLRSGSAAKLVTQAESEIQSGLGEQLAGLEKEKADKLREERLMSEQRGYQTAEREASQIYATGERTGTQDFQAGQAALDRALQQKNIDLGFDSLREQQRQFDAEFGENVRTNLFNKIIALKDINPEEFNQAAEYLGYNSSNIGNIVGQTGSIKPGVAGGQSSGGGVAPIPKAVPKAPASKGAAAKPASLDSALAGIKITSANIKSLKNVLANNKGSWASQLNNILSSSKVPAKDRAFLVNQVVTGGFTPANSVNQVANIAKKYKL
jgi:hypothetical protein